MKEQLKLKPMLEPGNDERSLAVNTPVVGASLAACVALWVVTRGPGARSARQRSTLGIVPTLLRGAFFGALRTIPQIILVRVLDKVVRRQRALSN